MIKIENLKKTYDRHTRYKKEVLHSLSFTLPDTGFVCILGSSGCGKTSLLNAIGGLDSFDSGKITTNSSVITRSPSPSMEKERNSSFGYIFQNYYLLPSHSVSYNVYIGLHSLDIPKKEKMARVREALKRVDMLRYRKRPVGELSGGQQQRVAIARAIVRRPKVIFADEPTGNLDEDNTINICNILKELSEESLVVMVTHEERIARFFADRIITLDEGKILSDDSDWARGSMDMGAKNTVYAGEYSESVASSEGLSVRVLTKDGAPPVSLTVIADGDRIIIKSDDNRTVLSSKFNEPTYLAEGKRPVVTAKKREKGDTPPVEKENTPTPLKKSRGLEAGLILKEAKWLSGGKRLKRFGISAFIILLSIMLSITMADIVTIAKIDPEDFVVDDSHILEFSFNRGEKLEDHVWNLSPHISEYIKYLGSSEIDFDFVPSKTAVLRYQDSLLPQLSLQTLSLDEHNVATIERLDPSTLIYGRMPERSDEIVVDRWVIEKTLEQDGIMQNIIPNVKFLLGKKLMVERKTFAPTIVGICDSGAPTTYMSKEALLSVGACGSEVMTLSEFKRLTGYDGIDTLDVNRVIMLVDNAGSSYKYNVGGVLTSGSGMHFRIADAFFGYTKDAGISAKMIISDDALEPLYLSMIGASDDLKLWCADKNAIYEFLDEPMPDEIKGMLEVSVRDPYSLAYTEYKNEVESKLDARTIVTASLVILSVVMLYLMQRSDIRSRMDLISVYRLLGIPKKNLAAIFAIESLIMTLKCALPAVLITWVGIRILNGIELLESIIVFPLSVASITLLAITAIRLLLSVLPVIRLLRQPPARLAAKYDF